MAPGALPCLSSTMPPFSFFAFWGGRQSPLSPLLFSFLSGSSNLPFSSSVAKTPLLIDRWAHYPTTVVILSKNIQEQNVQFKELQILFSFLRFLGEETKPIISSSFFFSFGQLKFAFFFLLLQRRHSSWLPLLIDRWAPYPTTVVILSKNFQEQNVQFK